MPKDLLFEIGVEEIPAGFVLPALDQLMTALRDGLARLRIGCGDLKTYGTPRRLAVLVHAVDDRQLDVEQEYKGPPLDKAFDAQGKPTRAAEGFARTRGVPVEALEILETDKGSWVVARVHEPGKAAAEVLPDLLQEVTLNLSFPKTMRWADLDLRFARPIRWLVALLGEEVLDLSIAGVQAGRASRGHRFLHPEPVIIQRPDQYADALRQAFVMADHEERKAAIAHKAQTAAAQVGGSARLDEDLLTEVNFLVEWPTCLVGAFDPRYLELPEPVIVKVMQGHQRYFPVEGPDGRLMPCFVAIRNGGEQGLDIVRAGNEKVIVPRLQDAEFYLTEDLKHGLDDRVASLSRVTYMEGLGTLADKTARIEALVAHLAEALQVDPATRTAALRAAHLCKADLVTLMVGDGKLGELQGIIGGEYARRQGEDEAVATALAEQYRPRGAGDALPSSLAGTLLSIADKMDNLVACFRLGQVPSGSADPFALRRQAQGIVEMLLARGLRVDLPGFIALALELLPTPQLPRDKEAARVLSPDAAAEELLAFFAQRLDYLLTRDGVAYDLCRAVLGAPWTDPVEAWERGQFLQTLRTHQPEQFDRLVTAAERPARIARPEKLPEDVQPDPTLFKEPWEHMLWERATQASSAVAAALGQSPRDYAAASAALADLAQPIHEFFAAVMVMVPEPAIRTNRLAMMNWLDGLFRQMADFLEVVREAS